MVRKQPKERDAGMMGVANECRCYALDAVYSGVRPGIRSRILMAVLSDPQAQLKRAIKLDNLILGNSELDSASCITEPGLGL